MSWLFDPVVLWAVAARLGGFIILLPAIPGVGIPATARVGIVIWMSLFIAPMLQAPPVGLMDPWGLLFLLVGEFGIGLAYAGCMKLVFGAVELGASIIENDMGLSAARQYNPLLGGPTGPVVTLWSLIALVYYWILGFFPLSIMALRESFELVPPGTMGAIAGLPSVLRTASGIFTGALMIAAPIIAVGFVVNVCLGLAAKAVQQMNIFAESFAIRLVAVGFALVAFLPILLLAIRVQVEHALPEAARFLRALPG
jgi:flagellar biosynthetic protein FliR